MDKIDQNINKMLTKATGERIKDLRVKKGLTLEELANKVNPVASASIVSRWERGLNSPNASRMNSLAEFFGVPVEWLRFGNGPEETIKQQTDKQDALEDISQSLYEFNQFIEYLQKKEDFETLYFLTDFMEMAEKAKGWTYDPKRQ